MKLTFFVNVAVYIFSLLQARSMKKEVPKSVLPLFLNTVSRHLPVRFGSRKQVFFIWSDAFDHN